MDRVRKQIGIDILEGNKIPQRHVTVAVLDTGVFLHPDLNGRILRFKDFVNSRKEIYDDNGHGTHVCGILAGSGELSNGLYRGINPNIRLVVGKVLDNKGDGLCSTMIEGIDWVLKNKDRYQIKILNISIGIGDMNDKNKEVRLQKKILEAWDNGILVVCAAGNKGPKENTISALGGNSKVITVGCHDGEFSKDNPRRCETYSGRGKANTTLRKPDVVAPGTDIDSCCSDILYKDGMYIHAYVKKSGTSMATPIVSGCASWLYLFYPEISNEEVKNKLQLAAKDLGEPWNKQGYGMIQICY